MKMAVQPRNLLIVMLFAFASCSSESIEETVVVQSFNVLELESQLTQITNEFRQSNGLEPLQFNTVAYAQANDHNDYMISKGSLSHDNFSARASKIFAETQAKEVAENVAKDYLTAQATFEGWYNSNVHRENLEGDFTHMAISVKRVETGGLYYTQIFFK